MPAQQTASDAEALSSGLRRMVGARFGQAAAGAFQSGVTADSISAVLTQAFAFAGATLAGVLTQAPPEKPIACRDRCSHCCKRASVDTTAPEVLLLAAWLRANRTPDELAALTAEVSSLADETAGMTPAQRYWVKRACPFLKEDSCSVYPVRPLVCRGANSADVEACRIVFQGEPDAASIPQYGPQVALYHGLHDGLQSALTAAGRPADSLCLFPAMKIALAEPDAADRYGAGEDVFANARISVHRRLEGAA